MMILPMRAPAIFPGLSIRVPKIPVTVQTRFFFDRSTVKQALGKLKHDGLWRSSLLVRRTAQKSIRQVGNARPRLKVMQENRGVPMSALLKIPNLRRSTRDGLRVRMLEVQSRPPSPPGTPPHTHVPSSHMLGFRRNLYNAMDPNMAAAVIGPAAKGKDWLIPHLHEFGGTRTLVEFNYWQTREQRQMWHRDKLVYVQGLARWTTPIEPPGGQWVSSGRTRAVTYPARPFMQPALDSSMPRIAAMFAGRFTARRVVG